MGFKRSAEPETWRENLMEKIFCTAIVLAAGSGKRMGTKIAKQYLEIEGKPLLYYTLLAFERSPLIDRIVLTVGNEEQISYCQENILRPYGLRKVAAVIVGGKERYDSVWMGLQAIKERLPKEAGDGIVFIHDGARPLVSEDILERCFIDAQKYDACVAAVPVKDTIKIADENGFAKTTPRRDLVWQVQTPQTFSFGLIYDGYAQLAKQKDSLVEKGIKITDDAMVVETFTNCKVKLTEGSYRNLKVTTPEDLPLAEKYLQG